MTNNLFNASVELVNVNSSEAAKIDNVIDRYDQLSGYDVGRPKYVITTDAEYFESVANYEPSSNGKFGARFSYNIEGQYTIWFDPNRMTDGFILHELMHGTHRNLGRLYT